METEYSEYASKVQNFIVMFLISEFPVKSLDIISFQILHSNCHGTSLIIRLQSLALSNNNLRLNGSKP